MMGKIDKETLVPVGMVAGCLTVIVAGVWWLSGQLTQVNYELRHLREDLNRLEQSVATGTMDRWTGSDMRHWVEMLKAKNPGMDIPGITK